MSTTLHYSLRITDPDLTVKVEDVAVEYDRRLSLHRVLKSTDGEVAIDLSDVDTMSVLYIHTTSPITVKVTGPSTTEVESDLFVTNGMDVISIQNMDEDVDAVVDIYAYGSIT